MTLLSTLLSLSALVCSLIIAVIGIREMRQARRSIPSFDDYIWQENGEWRIDERIGKMLDYVGSRFALSTRQALFQQMGVDAKLQKHVDKAISLDFMDTSGIGGILDLLGMGNTKQILAKNPRTLGIILQRVAPFLGQWMKNQHGSPAGGASSRDPFNLG